MDKAHREDKAVGGQSHIWTGGDGTKGQGEGDVTGTSGPGCLYHTATWCLPWRDFAQKCNPTVTSIKCFQKPFIWAKYQSSVLIRSCLAGCYGTNICNCLLWKILHSNQIVESTKCFQRPFIWTKYQSSISIRSWDTACCLAGYYGTKTCNWLLRKILHSNQIVESIKCFQRPFIQTKSKLYLS